MMDEVMTALNMPTRRELDTTHQRVHGLQQQLGALQDALENITPAGQPAESPRAVAARAPGYVENRLLDEVGPAERRDFTLVRATLLVDVTDRESGAPIDDAGALVLRPDATFLAGLVRDASGNLITGAAVTWTSSDPSVATIGGATGLATAIANGSTTITATLGTLSASVTLTVAQAVASVVVTPSTTTLTTVGATQQLAAEARDANGNAVAGRTFAWTSANASVATVDPASGLVTAVGSGTTTVTATTGAVSGAATVNVALVVTSVVVTPTAPTLTAFGATQQFTAVARDANDSPIPGQVFTWSSSNTAVATVATTTGLATAVGNGTTTITATTGTVSAGDGRLVGQGTGYPVAKAARRLQARERALEEGRLGARGTPARDDDRQRAAGAGLAEGLGGTNQAQHFFFAAVGAQREFDQAIGDAEEAIEHFAAATDGRPATHVLHAGVPRQFRQVRPRNMPKQRHICDDPFQ